MKNIETVKDYCLLYFLLFLFLGPLLLDSCDKQNENSKAMIEHRQRVESRDHEIITEFTYKNHKYIAIQEEFGYYAWGGIVHDPDCPCHNDTLYLIDTLQIDTLKH